MSSDHSIPESGGQNCPKCGAAQRADHAACPRCGLMFDKWSDQPVAESPCLDEKAESLWRDLQSNWTSEDAHDAFLKHCSVAGLLGPAGRRYRDRLQTHPDDAMALQMQRKILAMATALMGPVTQAPGKSFVRSSYFWMILMLGAVGGMLAGLVFRR